MKSELGFYHYLVLILLTLVSIGLGVFNIYLSRSGIIFDFATGLVFNMAILSLVIVVSGVLVTVFGLARLQSIEEKATQAATEVAGIVARDTVREEVKQEVKKNIETLYDTGKKHIRSFPFETSEEEEQGETD